MLLGPSGSGKSSLALEMLAYGGALVSDDRTQLTLEREKLVATAPNAIRGQIEARGFGILHADACEKATVCAIVKMDAIEHERLPPKRYMELMSVTLPLFHRVETPSFAAILIQYLKRGALDPDEHR